MVSFLVQLGAIVTLLGFVAEYTMLTNAKSISCDGDCVRKSGHSFEYPSFNPPPVYRPPRLPLPPPVYQPNTLPNPNQAPSVSKVSISQPELPLVGVPTPPVAPVAPTASHLTLGPQVGLQNTGISPATAQNGSKETVIKGSGNIVSTLVNVVTNLELPISLL